MITHGMTKCFTQTKNGKHIFFYSYSCLTNEAACCRSSQNIQRLQPYSLLFLQVYCSRNNSYDWFQTMKSIFFFICPGSWNRMRIRRNFLFMHVQKRKRIRQLRWKEGRRNHEVTLTAEFASPNRYQYSVLCDNFL